MLTDYIDIIVYLIMAITGYAGLKYTVKSLVEQQKSMSTRLEKLEINNITMNTDNIKLSNSIAMLKVEVEELKTSLNIFIIDHKAETKEQIERYDKTMSKLFSISNKQNEMIHNIELQLAKITA